MENNPVWGMSETKNKASRNCCGSCGYSESASCENKRVTNPVWRMSETNKAPRDRCNSHGIATNASCESKRASYGLKEMSDSNAKNTEWVERRYGAYPLCDFLCESGMNIDREAYSSYHLVNGFN
jgi:hypothetical protein